MSFEVYKHFQQDFEAKSVLFPMFKPSTSFGDQGATS